MNCCICSGVCMHVGPHSYCAGHSLTPEHGMYQYYQWPLSGPVPSTCIGHCYCLRVEHGGIKHRQCCNCANKQALVATS